MPLLLIVYFRKWCQKRRKNSVSGNAEASLIAVFLFGTKQGDDGVVLADGMEKEFEIAREQGLAVVPVGATGGMAKELSDRTLVDPAQFIPELGENGPSLIQGMAEHTDNLSGLIEPLISVIRKLQGGNAS